MPKLAITKIDNDLLDRRAPSWITADVCALMRELKPGEMIELTAALASARGSIRAAQVRLRQRQKELGVGHLSTSCREDRLFAIYWPEQRDGTG